MEVERVVLRLSLGGPRLGVIEALAVPPEGTPLRLRPGELGPGLTLCLFGSALCATRSRERLLPFAFAQSRAVPELVRAPEVCRTRVPRRQVLPLPGQGTFGARLLGSQTRLFGSPLLGAVSHLQRPQSHLALALFDLELAYALQWLERVALSHAGTLPQLVRPRDFRASI